jgi:sigma54-dependent transcription regulator
LVKASASIPVVIDQVELSSPTDFAQIYKASVGAVRGAMDRHGEQVQVTYHLSPGTPAMAAVWIILSKTSHPASLIESSKKHGARDVTFPFDLAAELIPELVRRSDGQLERLSTAIPPETPSFPGSFTAARS